MCTYQVPLGIIRFGGEEFQEFPGHVIPARHRIGGAHGEGVSQFLSRERVPFSSGETQENINN